MARSRRLQTGMVPCKSFTADVPAPSNAFQILREVGRSSSINKTEESVKWMAAEVLNKPLPLPANDYTQQGEEWTGVARKRTDPLFVFHGFEA